MPTIDVQGIAYHYRDEGRGPLVILAHSDASSSAQWKGLIDALSGSFRLIAYDLSGQGRSGPWPPGRHHDTAAEVAPVLALASLAEGPVHLVGHSAGGYFILQAAMALRERLASLTLIEPTAFPLLRLGGHPEAWSEISAVARAFQAQVREGQTEQAMERFVDYWTEPGRWAAIAPERRAALLAIAPKVAQEFELSWQDHTPLETYASLRVPTLLLHGERTTRAARQVVELLHEAWPHSRLESISGAGHMAPVTHSSAVNALVTAHLRQCLG